MSKNLILVKDHSFPTLIVAFDKYFKTTKISDFKYDALPLVEAFNHYLSILAHQVEVTNLWEHDAKSNVNQLTMYQINPTTNTQSGYAYVPQYRESTILRHLFTIDTATIGTSRFVPYETAWELSKPQNKTTQLLESLCMNASMVIKQIKTIQNLISEHENEAAAFAGESLSNFIKNYQNDHAKLIDLLNKEELQAQDSDSKFFYAISDSELEKMSNDQLVTICFEELNDVEVSPLLFRIIKNDGLWKHIADVLNNNFSDFAKRQDAPQDKKAKLQKIRQEFESFFKAQAAFDQPLTIVNPENLALKKAQFDDLKKIYDKFPPDFKKYVEADLEKRVLAKAFYLACEEYESHATVSAKKGATQTLTKTAQMLSDRVDIQSICGTLLDADKTLQQLSDKNVVAEDTPITEVKTTLQKLNTGLKDLKLPLKEKFMEQALQCKTLWQAISTTEKTAFSTEIIEDLLQIKTFCDSKLLLNQEKHFGGDYSQSIEQFYCDAVDIRLSSSPVQAQAQDIVNAAKKEFDHRHSTRRLVADVCMMVSVLFAGLGLVLGVGRVLAGKTFFFSAMPTDRNADLESLINKPESEEEMTRVFAAPSA